MGSIVGAFGLSHILLDDEGIEDQAERVFSGFEQIGAKVQSLRPDLIIIASDDHMFNISTDLQVPLAVGVDDYFDTFGDLDIPRHVYRGHQDFSQGFIHYAAENGFDLAKIQRDGFKLDHGFVVPLMFMTPDHSIPVVPINVNINMEPSPSPARCWQLGSALREYVERERPSEERVVVVGAGGLSHWLMVERHGEINEEWDREILATFAEGRAEELVELSTSEIAAVAGNGGTEIRNWLLMAATVPGKAGREIFYEPVDKWHTGMGGVEIHP